MLRKRLIFVIVFLIFFVFGVLTFYFFGSDMQKQFFGAKDSNAPGGAIAKNEPVVTCGAGDKACAAKNERIMANRLDSPTAKFVSHQCDGPRACPTPNEEQASEFIKTIRSYAKNPQLQLIRMTGTTPSGLIYYCVEDERCWSYDTKTKKVIVLEDTITSTSSGALN